MGQPYPDGEACGYGNESAITSKSALLDDETGHMVRLTDDYYIGVYEVTQGQMLRIAGTDSSNYKPTENRLLHPTEYCSFEQLRGAESGDYKGWPESEHAVGPSSLLQTLRSHTGVMFDLPTEAQWEFACRAGTGTPLNSGKELSRGGLNAADANMDEVGWYYRNCDEGAHHRPVGLKAANAFGLHDMHGNVGELCLDRAASGADYRATFATGWEDGAVSEDPEGAGSGTLHTARGGCYFFEASLSRSAVRYHKLEAAKQHKMVGFRLVCPVGSDWK
jgi:formylglycine-generating enzyme required for sulfatase activity